jgi:beta-glucosidase/6-phospho-beta-glucosidase/beta-galactosidase
MRRFFTSSPPLSLLTLLPVALLACSSDPSGSTSSSGSGGSASVELSVKFAPFGSTSAPSGKGSFRFGASSAATQIEDQNTNVDWYIWTAAPPAGLGKTPFMSDASKGYSLAIDDVTLLADMHLDSYRFSMEWARIMPKRGMVDEAAIKHYRDLLEALKAKGIRPMVTVHHFSNPIWVDDPRDLGCKAGPTDNNLCGFNHKTGGPLVVAELAAFAKLLAERFGDLVDDWCTVNEPINYLLAGYGNASFPPGKAGIFDLQGVFIPALRNYISAHAAIYKAIKAADTKDADGDGVAASVGLTKEAGEWVAARDHAISTDPADLAARDRLLWLYQYLFVDAIRGASFDADLDGKLDEPHPEWKGTLDWLGVQYYTRAGVTGKGDGLPGIKATPCGSGFDDGSCIAPLDPTYVVPAMEYEHDPAGLYVVLSDFGKRWPDLPFTVTESGIATQVGARRAEMIVRALEQVDKALKEGVDVRGYYHWSIYDNFEWARAFGPRFGLYSVDFTTYKRSPTEGATVFGEIAQKRGMTKAQQDKYGGSGPMTAEKVQ